MRILIVSQHFWPESFRINEVANSLVERGENVEVLTGKPNYPDGEIFPGYKSWGCIQEVWNGVKIFRIPIIPRGNKNPFRLALNYLSFIFSGLSFGIWSLRENKSDVVLVYATSPLLQAIPAILISFLKRIPVVIYVQDLWPESVQATGYINKPILIHALSRIVRFIYQRADLILISSRPFEDSVKRFTPAAKVIYFPNSVENSFCDPLSGPQVDLSILSTGFNIVFAGNVGSAQAVDVIIRAAQLLRGHPSIRFVIIGSGSELSWMIEQKELKQLDNVIFLGRYPSNVMPGLLARASVLLATLADRDIFSATVPNKIQAYLAVGRPIIACMNGEGGRIINEAKAGLAVSAEDADSLAAAILQIEQLPANERHDMGLNGQEYYRTHFNHEKLIDELINQLTNLIKAKK